MFLTRFVLEVKLLFNCFLTCMSKKQEDGWFAFLTNMNKLSVISTKKCCQCQREERAV